MTEDLHANCWHTTRPEKTARERAEKCGCIHMIGNKVCCECREYQDQQYMDADERLWRNGE